MSKLQLKLDRSNNFNTIIGSWCDAWDSSIGLGYPEDRLKDLPSNVRKIEITHPDNNITYVPFARDGNEYWAKKKGHLTIDGKFPLKLREYIKFRIRYNLGPNINGVSTNVNSVWNNNTAFAYTTNNSTSISNPENYYILLIGRAIYKIDRTVGGEQFVLIQSPLSVNRIHNNSGKYLNYYSIIGEGEYGTQWCDAGEAADWAGETAKIYWFLVNNVEKLKTDYSVGIGTPHCNPHTTAESKEDYIKSETTGTPKYHGIVSCACRSAGVSLQWQSGHYYNKFFFNDKDELSITNYWYTNYKSDLSGTPVYDASISTNATFNIVKSGEVTLSCTEKRKKIGKTWQQIGADGYGNPIHGYMYHVSEGDNQTDAYSDYIYIYL